MTAAAHVAVDWVERGIVPDALIRAGIRRLCAERLREIHADDCEAAATALETFVQSMNDSDVAPVPAVANEQHYEVPAEFFRIALGPHRKYSCAWWPEGVTNLGDAETMALSATCERAQLADGQHILELGCGWGSLTLWMAARYPNSRITAVSNSHSQRTWIETEAVRRRHSNVRVVTADMNHFDTDDRYDRVVSVEMFEHMRNWHALFGRIRQWLVPDGRFFMHVFCHRSVPYAFIDRGHDDWMSRHFFSGGMMPSDDLPIRFQSDMKFLERWRWNGCHYEKTANAWLANIDANRDEAMRVLAQVHGNQSAELWLQRWRIFFMACAELFGYRAGSEWWVGHYLFERP